MDELSILDITNGIMNEMMKSQAGLLIQLLINKVADMENKVTKTENETILKVIFNYFLIFDGTNPEYANEYCILLNNITTSEINCEWFLDSLSNNTQSENIFKKIVNQFLNYDHNLEPTEAMTVEAWTNQDPLQYISGLLCNIAQSEQGRKIILLPSNEYMKRIILQIRSRNIIRRRGCVSCLRSCLFDQDIHWWVVSELNVLPTILIPLVVPIPFTEKEKQNMDPILWMKAEHLDPQYETDSEVQIMLLECILILCQRRSVREHLRLKKVYPVIKNFDGLLQNESISDVCFKIVDFLMGEEDPDILTDQSAANHIK